jgi:dGTPase
LFRRFDDAVVRQHPAATPKLRINEALRRTLNAFVNDLMNEMRTRVAALGATTLDEIRRAPCRLASFNEAMEAERATAKAFLYANFYNSPGMEEAHHHAAEVVEGLFAVLIADPGLLPEDHQSQIPTEGLARTVADYIAGMTDNYIDQLWSRCCG